MSNQPTAIQGCASPEPWPQTCQSVHFLVVSLQQGTRALQVGGPGAEGGSVMPPRGDAELA